MSGRRATQPAEDDAELRRLGCVKMRGRWSHPSGGDELADRILAGALTDDERATLAAGTRAAAAQAKQFDALRRRARRTRNGG